MKNTKQEEIDKQHIQALAKILVRIAMNPEIQEAEKVKHAPEGKAKEPKPISHANVMKQYRKEQGLTQEQVATLLGFTSSKRIAEWENAKTTPNLTNLAKLCCVYNVPFQCLYPELFENMYMELDEKKRRLLFESSFQKNKSV